ncbi:galactosylgalactosylxylosylprotein 3-beta-glucuronosyltransferase 2-like isoform X2 [Halichondria panicea]|uniref:galactosylgalactosylxylosylprotein 3-beta-glucuronosyltransferase 2-like isoform X2 n=1 Tax=Halichondria panicea TaxID=6063 RepID=UPI00312B6671
MALRYAFLCQRHRWFYLGGCIILLLVTVAVVGLIIAEKSFQVESLGPISLSGPKVTENSLQQVNNLAPNIQVKASKKCVYNQKTPTPPIKALKVVVKNEPPPTIFAITHTRKRLTQLLDLTSLCQSLMNVENMEWIVVENTFKKTALVSDLLNSCKVNSVHLLSTKYSMLTKTNGTDTNIPSEKIGLQRGAKEKNTGLEWIRKWCQKPENCSGLVYFLDDESKYDLRLFKEMRKIQHVGVWPVGFAGQSKFQGPVCKNGSSVEWHTLHATTMYMFGK